MCGYLDLKIAEKFKDVAVKIVGYQILQRHCRLESTLVRSLPVIRGYIRDNLSGRS